MSKTTFQIGQSLQQSHPGLTVTQLSNFKVPEDDLAENIYERLIAGVWVRYEVKENSVEWCYI